MFVKNKWTRDSVLVDRLLPVIDYALINVFLRVLLNKCLTEVIVMAQTFERYDQSYYTTHFLLFFIIYTSLVFLLLFFPLLRICLPQASQKEVCGLDLPPPQKQTDTPALKKNKSRPPPLKNTTGSMDKWVAEQRINTGLCYIILCLVVY